MAMVNITKVQNFSSKGNLELWSNDDSRRPKRKHDGRVFNRGEHIVVKPGEKFEFEWGTLVVSWADNGELWVEIPKGKAMFNVSHEGAFEDDYLRCYDAQERLQGKVNIGVQGMASNSDMHLNLYDNELLWNVWKSDKLTVKELGTVGKELLKIADLVIKVVVAAAKKK